MKDPGLSKADIKKLLDKIYLRRTVGLLGHLAGPIGATVSYVSPKERENFKYYHLNRNQFNIKQSVISLTRKYEGSNEFVDNHGNIWTEQRLSKNKFHMPKKDYDNAHENSDVVGYKPYSRKFLRDDTGPLKGEFELIIHKSGERIDGDNEGRAKYQETYNYGRTRNGPRHSYLDIKPHLFNGNYMPRKEDMGSVIIYEYPFSGDSFYWDALDLDYRTTAFA